MLNEGKKMDMPTMPPTPRPALVLNLSLPMVKGGKIIPQPLWMESQLKDYAQQHALQFERAAASLALERSDLEATVSRLRDALCAMLYDDDHDAAKNAARAALAGLGA